MTATASLLLGAALGLTHAAAGVGFARLARGKADKHFAAVVLGGTALRMFAALAVVVLLLYLGAVETAPFLAGLGVTFVIGLLTEVILLVRRPMAASPRA